tara:strand:+ start:1577 stop:2737 length:1161 start_codon:yes stop_codon:yes gene_type:complete
VKKICLVTGSRAEYGLLKHLIEEINQTNDLSLHLVVTGSHLSKRHGYTINEIKDDKFEINEIIDPYLKDDSDNSTCNSMAKIAKDISKIFSNISLDLIIVLGDRYELLSVVFSATIHKIPIAHIHGGETTQGSFDEGIRHAITKLSHLHFVSTEMYKKRVVQLGESPKNIFNVGGLGTDAIKRTKLIPKNQLEKDLGINFRQKNLLITYHPLTLSPLKNSLDEIRAIIEALKKEKETLQLFTMPNADPGNQMIYNIINSYVKNSRNTFSFKSLGQRKYYSCLAHVDAVIGNSSSGLLEAPSFNIGTINVGDRQKGRLSAKSIINCRPNSNSISTAISKIYSKSFKETLKNNLNPYGEGGSAKKIVNILKEVELDSLILKEFHDIDF